MSQTAEFEADLVIDSVEVIADDVVAVTLRHPAGEQLPSWEPGAHIDLVLTPDLVRQYSLCGSTETTDAYTVAVLKAPDSRGGSTYVHDRLKTGGSVTIRGPRNNFELAPASNYIFIAGGIGITPMLPMIAKAEAQGSAWTLLYGGRSETSMAYAETLRAFEDRVTFLPGNDVPAMTRELDARLGTPKDDTLVYVCGPEGLIAAVEGKCAAWPVGALHLERFTPKVVDGSENVAFDVVLSRTGKTITVPADRSIFEAIEDNGVVVLGSCHEGICGTCETVIVDYDGVIEHRDSVLNEEEQAANETMMICVSRCSSGRLVLDI